MTMRAMDDVKESCRAAAATTMHTLQSVTLRLADPAATAAEDAAKAMNMMLPFLLTKCRPPPFSCFHMRALPHSHVSHVHARDQASLSACRPEE